MCGRVRCGGVVDLGGELTSLGLSHRRELDIVIITRLCWLISHRLVVSGKS